MLLIYWRIRTDFSCIIEMEGVRDVGKTSGGR